MIRIEIKNKPYCKTRESRLCITVTGCEDGDMIRDILSHLSAVKGPKGVLSVEITSIFLGIRIFIPWNNYQFWDLMEFSTDKAPEEVYNRSVAKYRKRFPTE